MVNVMGRGAPYAAVYSPNLRYTGLEACCHVYFDELRDPATRQGDKQPPSVRPSRISHLFCLSMLT
jgi:hypothetical protein